MAKTLTIKNPANGKVYTLEYTRETVEQMERAGFDISKAMELSRPLTDIETLFWGAFLANHKQTSRNVVREMWQKMPNKDKVVQALVEMYQEPLNTLMEEPEEGDEGNMEWTASW